MYKTIMAEGGEDPQENPFSFKKFVKKKSSPSEENQPNHKPGGGDDNFSDTESGAAAEAGGKGAKQAEGGQTNGEKKDENPFSFKKFLKTGGARPKTSGNLSTFDLASDLPDFVQDHFTNDQGLRRHRNPDMPLPDFALDSSHSPATGAGFLTDNSSPKDFHNDFVNPAVDDVIHSNGALPGSFPGLDLEPPGGVGSRSQASFPGIDLDSNFVPIPHMDPPGLLSDSPEPELDMPQVQANSTGVLPDFLSDSAVNTFDVRANLASGSPASLSDEFLCHNGDLEVELRRLREENRQLRKQLDEARQFADTESKRVANVLREMESIQKKEAEDTAALENMVQQVEANLQITTQRAVSAENTIAKLKQELKASQNQVQSLRAQNRSLRASGATPHVDPVREKAKYASEQINTAAKNAEQMLKAHAQPIAQDMWQDLILPDGLNGFPVDVFAPIYPAVLPGLEETELIMDKRQLCVRALHVIQSITDATRTKTLRFENHDTIEESRHKLVAIYQPLKHFCKRFMPGYQPSNTHYHHVLNVL